MKQKPKYHPSTKKFLGLSPEQRRQIIPQLKENDKYKILQTSGYGGTELNILKYVLGQSKDEYGACHASIPEIAANIGRKEGTARNVLHQLVKERALKAEYRHHNHSAPNRDKTTLHTVDFENLQSPKKKAVLPDRAERFKQYPRSVEGEIKKDIAKQQAIIMAAEQKINQLRSELARLQDGAKPNGNSGEIADHPSRNRVPTPPEICTTTYTISGVPPYTISAPPPLQKSEDNISKEYKTERKKDISSSYPVGASHTVDGINDISFSNQTPKPLSSSDDCIRQHMAAALQEKFGITVESSIGGSRPSLHNAPTSAQQGRGEAEALPMGDSIPEIGITAFNEDYIRARMQEVLNRRRA